MNTILQQTQKVVELLNEENCQYYIKRGYNCYLDKDNQLVDSEKFYINSQRKYFHIDCGTSGVYLVEKKTGEIFNIKSYGQADRNRKRKSDIGNVATVDPKIMFQRRWNYLR